METGGYMYFCDVSFVSYKMGPPPFSVLEIFPFSSLQMLGCLDLVSFYGRKASTRRKISSKPPQRQRKEERSGRPLQSINRLIIRSFKSRDRSLSVLIIDHKLLPGCSFNFILITTYEPLAFLFSSFCSLALNKHCRTDLSQMILAISVDQPRQNVLLQPPT